MTILFRLRCYLRFNCQSNLYSSPTSAFVVHFFVVVLETRIILYYYCYTTYCVLPHTRALLLVLSEHEIGIEFQFGLVRRFQWLRVKTHRPSGTRLRQIEREFFERERLQNVSNANFSTVRYKNKIKAVRKNVYATPYGGRLSTRGNVKNNFRILATGSRYEPETTRLPAEYLFPNTDQILLVLNVEKKSIKKFI